MNEWNSELTHKKKKEKISVTIDAHKTTKKKQLKLNMKKISIEENSKTDFIGSRAKVVVGSQLLNPLFGKQTDMLYIHKRRMRRREIKKKRSRSDLIAFSLSLSTSSNRRNVADLMCALLSSAPPHKNIGI